jgi:excisionase family DNA binding protein
MNEKPTDLPPIPGVPTDLIDLKEAAQLCDRCHINTIRRLVLNGKIPGYRRGQRRMMVSKSDLLAHWVKRIEIPNAPPMPLTKKEIEDDEAWVQSRLEALGVRPKKQK